MPTQVTYNGKRLIPAPQVAVQKTYQKTGDGTIVGSLFELTINGTLVAFKGSPNSEGTFYTGGDYPSDESIDSESRLYALQNKMEAIRELFAQEGMQLEFQAADGSPPMKCNPQINNISFAQGIWFDRMDYTITCQANTLLVDGHSLGEDRFTEYIESASENWSFEVQDDQRSNLVAPTYRLTHSVQAKGKRQYTDIASIQRQAWQEARNFVLPRLGLDTIFSLASGVNSLPGYYNGYNHIRTQTHDELEGTFSVTENWIISSGDSIEDYNINYVESAEDGRKQVTIDGTITGFETKSSTLNVTKTKYEAAADKFALASGVAHTRAQAFTGLNNLNLVPLNITIGRNPIQGTIQYSFEYDNRPSNLITDAKSETISVGTNWDVDVVASIGVLNRNKGPVMQPLGSHQQATRNLNIELVFGADYVRAGGASAANLLGRNPRFVAPQSTQIQELIDAAEPVNASLPNNLGNPATTSYISEQTENWDIRTGRYSRTITWIYE